MERNAIEGGVSYNCCDTSLIKSCQSFLNGETQQKGFVTHILDVFLYLVCIMLCYFSDCSIFFQLHLIAMRCLFVTKQLTSHRLH